MPSRWFLLLTVAAFVAGPPSRAQHMVGSAECTCGQPPWLLRTQCADGHFSAAFFADRGVGAVPSPGAGRPIRDLRVTALVALFVLADGSTMRAGPYRASLRNTINWLRDAQDHRGRFALHIEPDWILDHAMATYAVAEAARTGQYQLLVKNVSAGLAALTEHLRHQRRNVQPELLLWCRMSTRSAAALALALEKRIHEGDRAALMLDIEALNGEIERWRPQGTVPEQPRQRAALLLLEELGDSAVPLERLAALAGPCFAADWPGPSDMEDPLTVLYYYLACYRLAPTPQFRPSWKRISQRLTPLLIRTQIQQGALKGSWDPHGAFGADGGRMCTSAVHILLLTVYYRYCSLELATGP